VDQAEVAEGVEGVQVVGVVAASVMIAAPRDSLLAAGDAVVAVAVPIRLLRRLQDCNQAREPSQLAPRRGVAGGSAPTARSPGRGLARHRRVSLDRTGAARQPQGGRGRRDSCRLAAISGRDSLDYRGEMDQGWPARH
jgi:hypothetical protein